MTTNRVAILTGSGQGIGAGCAREMTKAGYKVSLMSPSERSIKLVEEVLMLRLRMILEAIRLTW